MKNSTKSFFFLTLLLGIFCSCSMAVSFPDYFPLDPAIHGVKTFEWTYGRGGTFQSYISRSLTVPYKSGPIEGTGIFNYFEGGAVYFSRDDTAVKWIAFDGVDDDCLKYISSDPYLTSHPETWSMSIVTDNMYVDQGVYYGVGADGNLIETENTQALLFTLQDIALSGHQYNNAIVLWWLDKKYEHEQLIFPEDNPISGIITPTSEQTLGYSITDFEIYGYGIGVIAYGGVAAESGNITEIALLIDQSPYSSISGKAIDFHTGAPIAGINIEARRESFNAYDITDSNGCFELTQLPPGLIEIDVDGHSCGYASLDQIVVNTGVGEILTNRYIALSNQLATVSGYVQYEDGTAVSNAECYVDHHIYEESTMTDEEGKYEFQLPPGKYALLVDKLESQEAFVSTDPCFVINNEDVGQTVSGPNVTVFRDSEGFQITGMVSNPYHSIPEGTYGIVAFKAGQCFAYDAPDFYSINYDVSEQEIDLNNPFVITSLPAGNYDLYLFDASEDSCGIIESTKFLGYALNVSTGSHVDITIEYGNSIITGRVMDSENCPLVEADVVLMDATHSVVYYGTETDGIGAYELKNLLPGIYHLMAVHRRYHNVIKNIVVLENSQLVTDFNLEVIVNPEAMDLSGNGSVTLDDFICLTSKWLSVDCPEADFNEDNHVNLIDFSRFTELWLWKALWSPEGESSVMRDTISDHVFYIEVETEWDYDSPDDQLMSYDFELDVVTDETVENVVFITPTGQNYSIPPIAQNCQGEVCTYYTPNGQGQIGWKYYGRFSSESLLASYGDGVYVIIVQYSDGTQQSTQVWYGVPGTQNPILQPTIQPTMIYPLNNETTTSPVTFRWEQCLDPNASGNITVGGENKDNGDEFWLSLSMETTIYENVEMSLGKWDMTLSFENLFFLPDNGDGIPVEIVKCSTIDYWLTIESD